MRMTTDRLRHRVTDTRPHRRTVLVRMTVVVVVVRGVRVLVLVRHSERPSKRGLLPPKVQDLHRCEDVATSQYSSSRDANQNAHPADQEGPATRTPPGLTAEQVSA